MYRAWHSDPNARPTLFFIKRVLRLILNQLPQNKQTYTDEMANEIRHQWLNNHKLHEKYLPYNPRYNDQQSINLYEEHLTAMVRIMKMKSELAELKERQGKFDNYDQLISENIELEQEIDDLRSKTVH